MRGEDPVVVVSTMDRKNRKREVESCGQRMSAEGPVGTCFQILWVDVDAIEDLGEVWQTDGREWNDSGNIIREPMSILSKDAPDLMWFGIQNSIFRGSNYQNVNRM
jgi:hypothetical protein